MSKVSKDEKAIVAREKEFEYITDRYGPASMLTQVNHINSSRVIMWNSQASQWVSIKDPEQPLVPTGFENILASYSSMLEQAEDDYEIVAKFKKHDYFYILIGYDKKHQRYHAWKRTEMEEHSEGFSTLYNNRYLDSLEVGDTVKKGDYVHMSNNFDKHMNYTYGKNINVVYMVSTKVYEDGILAMNGVDKLFNTYRAHTVEIGLADNEILLNWYGDDDHYQGIPLVGEKVKDGLAAIVRRIDNAKAPYSLKKKYLRHPEKGDRKYFINGRVVDIDVHTNKDPKKLSQVGANKLIVDLFAEQQKFYTELYKYMRNIVDTADNDPHDCSKLAKGAGKDSHCYTSEFSVICEEAHDYVDASAFYADESDNVYGNTKIVLRILDEEKMIVGSKFVGRSGNKGVIARIIPPEKSWHMEDGRPIHFVVAGIGVPGRVNHAQLNEHSANELGHTAVEMMKKTDNLETKGKIIYQLLKCLNKDEAKAWKQWYGDLSDEKKAKCCRRIEKHGPTIIQPPIGNANILDYAKAYEKFPANWQRVVFEDGGKSLRKVLCAPMFYVRLKQDPREKYSTRSRGPVNPLTMLPSKSTEHKRFLAPSSNVPVRFGEMEHEILNAMVNHPDAIATFMMENSTSYDAKITISEQLYMDDPGEDVDMEGFVVQGKKNIEWIEAMIQILGTTIEIETEEAPDGEWFED